MRSQLEAEDGFASMSRFPKEVFQIYDSLEQKFSSRISWTNLKENELWNELCLCILSSNVQYELATSAVKHLCESDMLNTEWLTGDSSAKSILQLELSKPIYLPKKKDGTLRKYRFPRVRSRDIVGASNVLYSSGNDVRSLLSNTESPVHIRNYLAGTIPGLGLKESSHFLRNIGYASSLAIIDVHIVSFLQCLGLFPFERQLVTGKMYLELERIMQKISRIYDLNLSILDNAIWHYMRNRNS